MISFCRLLTLITLCVPLSALCTLAQGTEPMLLEALPSVPPSSRIVLIDAIALA